jgi:hypothetical protein
MATHYDGEPGLLEWFDASDAASAAATATANTAAASATASAASAAASASLVGAPADTAIATIVGNPASATSASLKNTYLTVFYPEKYGAVGDGITDDTAAILSTFAAVQAAMGGTVQFAAKHYLCLGALAVPNDGVSKQKPMRLQGTGANWDSFLVYAFNLANGGTVLDLRYDGTDTLHPAKIDTRGGGLLEISGITFLSGGTDNFPFLQTTCTTVSIKNNAFVGNAANTAATCVQDAIILGGLNFTAATILAVDHPFQGYGSVVADNYFGQIRRCVYARYYANSVRIVGNTVAATCGATDATAGAFNVLGGAGGGKMTEGVVIRDNLIEVTGYIYGVFLDYAWRCIVDGNQFWDGNGRALGCVYLTANSSMNSLTDGLNLSGSGLPFAVEATPGLNTIIATLSAAGGSVALYADQVHLGRVTNNVNIGALGTADCYLDTASGSSNTNVPLHIRAKGNSSVKIDSHLAVEGMIPTVAGEGGSTSPTIVGSDNGGNVTFTTAASVAADVSVVRINYNTAWAGAVPQAVVICPLNAAAAAAAGWVVFHDTNWLRIALHTPPATATVMIFSFIVLGAN